MKRIRRILAWILVLALTAADGGASALAADTLALPAETTVIEEEAFFGDTSLDEVVLPEGVTAIGPRAFAGSSVSRIYLPASLTEIAEDAFSACDWVVGYGPDGTTASAFFDRHGNLTFEREHDIWEDFSFEAIDETSCRLGRYYGTDTEVRIPSHNADGLAVTEISSSAFSYKNIQSVYVPEGVTVISSSAFMECHDLTEVVLPESLKSIGYNAFAECTSLQSLHIPDSVETLYSGVFFGCDSLTEVNVPASLTTVVNYGSPFDNCPALRTVTVPEGLTVIPSYLFEGLLFTCIETITLPSTLKRIEWWAFSNTNNLKSLIISETDGLIIEDGAFYGCSGLESVVIGEGLTEIGNSAFENCTSLSSVMLPDSLKTVGNCAFQGCSALTALELPRSVTRISLSMFAGCSSLSYMPLRDSVTQIGAYAFENCALETVLIPDGVQVLEYYTFKGNAGLNAVYIPPSVTSVVNDLTDVFAGCAAPLSIYGWSGSYIQEHFEDYDGDFVFCDVAETGLPFGADGAALPAEAAARITGVSLDEASIEVGSAMKFRVSTQNATRVQLVVDGEYYDEYTVDGDGTVQAQRVLTMAGDRQVAFRAYGEGGWGPVSPAQTLQVTAEGALAAPEAQ
nr:leucine-rich repeat domain-containing protein [Oscillospiraceae bacterium]